MVFNWFSSKSAARGGGMPPSRPSQPAPVAQGSRTQIDGATTLSWQELARHLGTEVASALDTATRELDKLNRLEPSLVRGLRPVLESVERAREAGMATQRLLRLHEDPPVLDATVLNLADVARAALTARSDWLTRHGIAVRDALQQTRVHTDATLLYSLIDELLQWAGGISRNLSLTVDTSQSLDRPRLRMTAWCKPAEVPESTWHCTRWHLWHQLARSLGVVSKLDMLDNRVRITITLPPVTDEQLATAMDSRDGPSSVSAIIQGCRVLIVSEEPGLRARCMQALAGYGLVLETANTLDDAYDAVSTQPTDAVVFDDSLSRGEIHQLREAMLEQGGASAAFIEIRRGAQPTDFQVCTVGTLSTGHVAEAAIAQSLGPALVFELCKVM
ncbi:hypothetical protein [Ottowia sp.]|uniref:hypothetical protein n=1 Tax=Ottowia sp. TaxID=1898956 RepID=UPI00262E0EEB|nr:hypothetical protein [Ottowia sp.]